MNVVRSVEVAVDPATAFRLFTEEIGSWYRSGKWSWNDPVRAKTILIEPGVGGRWLEVWDEEANEGYELGRVLVWEPGERVVLTYRNVHMPPGDTEVEIRFGRPARRRGSRSSIAGSPRCPTHNGPMPG